MLKHGDINPLNVFDLRELKHCAPHFCKVTFDLKTNEKSIKDWIYTNLQGRFWLGDVYTEDESDSYQMVKCAAFEIHAEASYFSLMLDTFNNWEYKLFE